MRVAMMFKKYRVEVGPVVFCGTYQVRSLDEPIFGNTGLYGGTESCLGTARFEDLSDMHDEPNTHCVSVDRIDMARPTPWGY